MPVLLNVPLLPTRRLTCAAKPDLSLPLSPTTPKAIRRCPNPDQSTAKEPAAIVTIVPETQR